MRANALIHAAFGRILASAGSADKYVAKVKEAEALIKGTDDLSIKVTLKAVLCHALRLAGRMAEALSANTEASRDVHEIATYDRQLLGFDVELWLTVMRGQILVALGRFDEARPYLDRLLQLQADSGDLTHHVASTAYVDLAWAQGDAQLAEHHAARAFSIAEQGGSPYVRVHALAARGLAHLVAGRTEQGVHDLAGALAFARERRAGLEMEARVLADLANARRLAGDLDGAWQTATDAIDVARSRCARIPHCLAHIVRAHVLCAGGYSTAAQEELAKAEALIAETGARIFARPIVELRAKLRNTTSPSQYARTPR
jgi:adenylate cyclase